MVTTRLATALFTIPFLAACSSKSGEGDGGGGGSGIECPGVDGTYYYVTTATGDCGNLGTTIEDGGIPVANHGVMLGSISGCTAEVTYAGCTVTSDFSCAGGTTISTTQTFVPGEPSMVTGSQTQTSSSGTECVFEIYGSTDLELVQAHAGVSGTSGAAALATPSTPTPTNLPAATAACQSNAIAEEAACPSGGDVSRPAARCAESWSRYDAEGCGEAWLAYITCRTEEVGTLDCASGEISACTAYQDAYFQCQSAFASSTGCSVSGNSATNCAGGLGTYSYTCLGGTPPAANCVPAAPTGSSVAGFCCY